jgi:hypothetical protein
MVSPHYLGAEVVGLDQINGRAVDLDETGTLLGVGQGNGSLLAAEHLDRLLGSCLARMSTIDSSDL